jgi:hypothetical protein
LQIFINLIAYKSGVEVAAIRVPFGTKVFLGREGELNGARRKKTRTSVPRSCAPRRRRVLGDEGWRGSLHSAGRAEWAPPKERKKREKSKSGFWRWDFGRERASQRCRVSGSECEGLCSSRYMLCTVCRSVGALRLNSMELDGKMVKTHPRIGSLNKSPQGVSCGPGCTCTTC